MKEPFFSIIIPTLNEEHYVPLLLKDLRMQTHKNFEVIIVDGNSSDATLKKCHEFNDVLPLTVYHSEKRNVAFQKNLGAQHARGVYLIFLDADIRVAKGFIKRLTDVAKKTGRLILLPKVIPQEHSQIDHALFEFGNYFVEMSQLLGKPLPSMGCLIIEKYFFHHIHGFDVKIIERSGIAEDHNLMLRSRKAGVIAKYIPSVNIKFSLRRMKKEGRISLMQKYVLSGIILTRKGTIQSKIFEYEMGGQYYDKQESKRSTFSLARLKKYIKEL